MPRYNKPKGRSSEPDPIFAARIQELIEIYGGQIALAKAIGTSQANVSRWAQGKGATLNFLRLITRSLNLTTDQLIGNEEIRRECQVVAGVYLVVVKARLRQIEKVEKWKELTAGQKLWLVALSYKNPIQDLEKLVTPEMLDGIPRF